MVFKTKFRMKFRFTCAHFVCIFVCSFHRHHPSLHLKVVIIFFHPLLGSFYFALKIFVFFTLIFVVKCNEMRKKIRDVFFPLVICIFMSFIIAIPFEDSFSFLMGMLHTCSNYFLDRISIASQGMR